MEAQILNKFNNPTFQKLVVLIGDTSVLILELIRLKDDPINQDFVFIGFEKMRRVIDKLNKLIVYSDQISPVQTTVLLDFLYNIEHKLDFHTYNE